MAIKGLDGKELALSSLELGVICSFWLPVPNEKNIYSTDQKALPVQGRDFRNEVHFVSVLL